MQIQYDCFPGGAHKALTLSYDDGKLYDKRLVEKFNEYGLKGTFHLNSGKFGTDGVVSSSEVAVLYAGHEVSCHTVHHPFLEQTPAEQIVQEIMEDRIKLENIVEYPVRGLSYPFGTYSDQVVSLLPALGIEYARTIESHGRFDMPKDLFRWHPTCHHNKVMEYASQFVALEERPSHMALLYVWGHSYEFEDEGNWDLLDRLGEIVAGKQDIWYATNAEIVSYIQALKRLRFSADCRMVHNPSAQSVWVSINGVPIELTGGKLTSLGVK